MRLFLKLGESVKMATKSAIPTRRCGGAFEVPEIGVGCWSFGCKEGEYWGNREQAGSYSPFCMKLGLLTGQVIH